MTGPLEHVERWLDARAASWVAGAATALAVLLAWGGLRALPAFHDEKAYVLQAALLASGRWTGAPPVLPEFFAQAHVLVTPALAAKYFPGHALALAPGMWVGMPGLVVVLLAGIAGGLAHALARRAAGPWAALLTVLALLGGADALAWRASYFAESTSAALYLGTWAALLAWRDRPAGRRLALAALLAGLCVVTRPLTGVALALPAGLWALRRAARARGWTDVGVAAAAAAVALAILPLWSWRTTGDWRLTPQAAYTRDYMPYDTPGFGVRGGVPRLPVPPDLEATNAGYLAGHRAHVPAALPAELGARLVAIGRALFGPLLVVHLALALVGLARLPALARLPVATALLHVLLYLSYAHPAEWTLYYVELLPVPAFLSARGAAWLIERARGTAPGAMALALFGVVTFAAPVPFAVRRVRADTAATQRTFAGVERAMAGLAGERVLVFVRYPRDQHPGVSFVRNAPRPDTARVWTAYDRGADDARLLRLAPTRVPYLFDVASGRIVPLADAPPGVTLPSGYVISAPAPRTP